MREDLKKLKALHDRLIGLEMELDIREQDLQAIDKDLCYLHKLKETLIENLQILKKEKIVVMAKQYKQAVSELAHVMRLINEKTSLKAQIRKSLANIERQCFIYNQDYTQLHKQIQKQKIILFFDSHKKKKNNE